MIIEVRRMVKHVFVKVKAGQDTIIDLGLLDEDERQTLAQTLIDAAYNLGPQFQPESHEWFEERLKKCGIELPITEKEN